ncbi:MAG: type II secretion system F family protein, partial [Fusobacteriaceae bacterium]
KSFSEKKPATNISIFPKRIKENQVISFTRELAVMVESGLSLLGALNVQDESLKKGELKNLIGKLKKNITEGNSFFSGFLEYKNVFGPTYINLVRVGEISGNLGQTLEELALLLEKNQEIRKKVKGAMVYPVTVMIITIVITAGLILFVLPAFTGMFVETGVPLPFITQLLLDISEGVRKHWLIALGIIMVGTFSIKKIFRTEKGMEIKNIILYNIPIFGPLMREAVTLRFTRTLATLMEGGVSVTKSLEISAESIGDPYFVKKIKNVEEEIRSGGRIAKSLQKTEFFSIPTISMIAVGEESGEMVSMFKKISDYNEKHLNYIIRDALTLIEPIMVVLLGAIVGTIILAMYLPMFEMINIVDR